MVDYTIMGPKSEEFRPYQTLNYCEKIIADLTEKDVDEYSH